MGVLRKFVKEKMKGDKGNRNSDESMTNQTTKAEDLE